MDNPVAAAAYLVVALTAGAAGGYFVGASHGTATAKAGQDAKTVNDLTNILDANSALIIDSNAASKSMREALALRGAQDSKTTQEIKNVLAKTASSRVGCRFDDNVMRELEAARIRAAAAAAGGIRNTVSGPNSTSQ
jgi:isocitrate dehydrogenase